MMTILINWLNTQQLQFYSHFDPWYLESQPVPNTVPDDMKISTVTIVEPQKTPLGLMLALLDTRPDIVGHQVGLHPKRRGITAFNPFSLSSKTCCCLTQTRILCTSFLKQADYKLSFQGYLFLSSTHHTKEKNSSLVGFLGYWSSFLDPNRSSQYPYSGVVSIAIKTPSISTKDKLGYKFQVPSFKCMWIILQLKNLKAFATNALNL